MFKCLMPELTPKKVLQLTPKVSTKYTPRSMPKSTPELTPKPTPKLMFKFMHEFRCRFAPTYESSSFTHSTVLSSYLELDL